MGRKRYLILMTLFLFVMSFSFISAAIPAQTNINVDTGLQIFYPAYEVVQQNEDFFLHIHVTNKSNGIEVADTLDYCYLHLYNSTGYHVFEGNLSLDSNGIDWELLIEGGNFSTLGEHSFRIYCKDTFGGEVGGVFLVTLSGEVQDPTSLAANVFLIIFLVFSLLGVVYLNRNIDFDKWEEKVRKKEENNFFKTLMAGMGYWFMKDSFLIYYTLGWFIMFTLTNLTFIYNLYSMYSYMVLFTQIYSVGFVLIGLVFLARMIQFLVDLSEDLTNKNWGIE